MYNTCLKNQRAYISQTNEFQSLHSLTPLIGELIEDKQIQANPLSWKTNIFDDKLLLLQHKSLTCVDKRFLKIWGLKNWQHFKILWNKLNSAARDRQTDTKFPLQRASNAMLLWQLPWLELKVHFFKKPYPLECRSIHNECTMTCLILYTQWH